MTGPIGTAAAATAAAKAARPAGRALRRGLIAGGVVALLCLLCIGGATMSLLGGLTDDPATTALNANCGAGVKVDPNTKLPQIGGLTSDQVRNAAIIIQVGQQMRVPARGWVIAIATALQESRLSNLPHLGNRNDHDSIGVFQQRPSQGWGTVEQLSDPAYQARKFYEKLIKVRAWQTLALTVAAQRVQISAYPDAYAKHEAQASDIVDALTGGAARSVINVAAVRCAAPGEIAASGWTVPLKGPITSGYRTLSRPGHDGVDIGVAKGTDVRAAASGVVLTAVCNAHIGVRSYSCDRDGGIFVQGCGWYVDIEHAGGVITRYCHMQQRPFVVPGQMVAAGDVIGKSGSSGNSSGPHLHFEVHLNKDASDTGATNPVTFMAAKGAALTGSGA
ncbi:M23 family metallopeptidase [Luedemannella helvata]|uniref:M23ase beta-sheet core domain-containing protein n=1 Tax=Luedemannella helvata TaxID=349315 RepID=A0ABN2KE54_9ACTN